MINAERMVSRLGSRAPQAIRDEIAKAPARRVLISDQAFFPGRRRVDRCPRLDALCASGPLLRRAFLPAARVIAEPRLERVWRLESRPPGGRGD